MSFRVELEIFRGPMDLLLYLVRKHEVEITEIPIAPITAQFLEYIELLRQLDLNVVGDFVDMASTLLEIKSRMVLPHGGEEGDELPDPRDELVQRLLEYKKYKDAASMLDERSRSWQERFPRLSDDLPPRDRNLAEEELREVELWDLVSAFGRIMRDNQAAQMSNIVYDDTPIHVYMAQIQGRLCSARAASVSRSCSTRACTNRRLVGVFLAVLELVRNYHVRTEQNDLFGQIWILPGEAAAAEIDPTQVDNYDSSTPQNTTPHERARNPSARLPSNRTSRPGPPASASRGRKRGRRRGRRSCARRRKRVTPRSPISGPYQPPADQFRDVLVAGRLSCVMLFVHGIYRSTRAQPGVNVACRHDVARRRRARETHAADPRAGENRLEYPPLARRRADLAGAGAGHRTISARLGTDRPGAGTAVGGDTRQSRF